MDTTIRVGDVTMTPVDSRPKKSNFTMSSEEDRGQFDLSRRKLLGSVATIGAAGAIGGAGTMAFFSDEEEFANNQLTAGELDMKVGYSAHYSDWSDDEGQGVSVRMWDGAPGTTGTASDLESGETGLPANDAWLIAVDDPDQFLANTQYAEEGNATCGGNGNGNNPTDADDVEQPVIALDDVKPGDFGEVTFDFALCDNPGFVWLNGELRSKAENGITEPEAKDTDEEESAERPASQDSTSDVVELLDAVQAAYWIDDGNNYQNGNESPAFVGSLRDALAELSAGNSNGNDANKGALLPGDISAEQGGGMGGSCFSAGTTHSVAFAWWVPVDHGNEIQGDSATFDLGFYTEQCRHNSADGGGGQQNGITTTTGNGFVKQAENFNGDESISGGARARYGNNDPNSGAGELYVGDEPGTSGEFNEANYGPWPVSDVDWTVSYDASTDDLSFTFDGTTVSDTLDNPQPDGRIGVQCKADEGSVSAAVNSLSIGGSSQTLGSPNSVSASNDNGGRQISYLLINTALDGSTDFEISGTASISTNDNYSGQEGVTFDVVLE
jgi:predicted ribosomally synthesized peptide with SipW-like signal peptide